jgi:hypothetical protein
MISAWAFLACRQKTTFFIRVMKGADIQKGDLVRSVKYRAIGIVVDVFSDLDDKSPWIRVHFTSGKLTGSYQWCKLAGLEIIKKGDSIVPPQGAGKSGSL